MRVQRAHRSRLRRLRPRGRVTRARVRETPLTPGPRRQAAERRLTPEQRVRRAGGPEDEALYSCVCGYTFRAAVTASVTCPHCAAAQLW